MANRNCNPFDQLIAYLKHFFSNNDIAISRELMGGFEGANDFGYEKIFRVKSIDDLQQPEFLFELQWGIYESGVVNLSKISNNYLSMYLAAIYLYGDRVRPMSGDCDLTNLLIFVKGTLETKDQKIISKATNYLEYLHSETKSNITSDYCYKLSHFLILLSLKSVQKNKANELLSEIENFGVAVDDIVDVSFESVSWIEGMLNSIKSYLTESLIWTPCERRVIESVEKNFGIIIQ